MTFYSKTFLGDLPELISEVIQYFRNDFSTLHSCILVNRLWCRLAIPLLWEDPFTIPTQNYHFIKIYLQSLNENDKIKLSEYGINRNLFPSSTLFNYPSFIKCLNTSKIGYSIDKWVAAVRTYMTEEPITHLSPLFTTLPQNLNSDYNLPPISDLLLSSTYRSIPSLPPISSLNLPGFTSHFNNEKAVNNHKVSKNRRNTKNLIYKSLFEIFVENGANLRTFEVILIRVKDHNYFNNVYDLILRNPNFICAIKVLKLIFYSKSVAKLTKIDSFLSLLSSNSNSISTIYFHFQFRKNDISIEKYSSRIINSQKNLERILLVSNTLPLHHSLLSLKNSNCSNTLKTIIFYRINFKNIVILSEVFEQLNVLESVHILYCLYLNNDFIQQIISTTKPFKLKSLFMNEIFQIESFQLLLQKSGDYLENIELLSINESKQQLIELITKYCTKIKFFELPGFDNQNIYSAFDLIKNVNQNLNHLSIDFNTLSVFNYSSNEFIRLSSIVLRELGQVLPFKLEYLKLSLMIKTSDFEVFLRNSQNILIKKLLIRNRLQVGNEDILPYIEEYIMKKKRVKYLAFKEDFMKKRDLFSLKDEVKKFELYNIEVQNYDNLHINGYDFIKETY